MKTLLKIIGVIVLVYALFVVGFWVSGTCPKYINKMPTIVGPGIPDKGLSFSDVLSRIKMCPFSQVVE
jgi:hypothetical protein